MIVHGWNYSSPQMRERWDKCSPVPMWNWLQTLVTKVHSVFPYVPEALLSFLFAACLLFLWHGGQLPV